MLVLPISLVAAVAAFGRDHSAGPVTTRPPDQALQMIAAQRAPQQSALITLAQANEELPASEASAPADPVDAEALPAPPEEAPTDLAAPVATPEPAPTLAAPSPSDTSMTAGAATPTPTIDLSRVFEAPSIQTAIAQFSGMVPALPLPGGQESQGAPPAAQTQAAIMMATITAR